MKFCLSLFIISLVFTNIHVYAEVETENAGLPHFMGGPVVRGSTTFAFFGQDVVDSLPCDIPLGIYYGWVNFNNGPVVKMAVSIGYNPFFQNIEKSIEVHPLQAYGQNLTGKTMKIALVKYIRPELDFETEQDLLNEIQNDYRIADNGLNDPEALTIKDDDFFTTAY